MIASKLRVILPLTIFGIVSVTALVLAVLTFFLFKRSSGPTGLPGARGAAGPPGPKGEKGKDALQPGAEELFKCPSTGEVPMSVDFGSNKKGWSSVADVEMEQWLGDKSITSDSCQRYCAVNDNCAAYYYDQDAKACWTVPSLSANNYDSSEGIKVYCSGNAPRGDMVGSWKNKYIPKYSLEDGDDCKRTRLLSDADKTRALMGIDHTAASDSNIAWTNDYTPDKECTSGPKKFDWVPKDYAGTPTPLPWCYTAPSPPSSVTWTSPYPWGYIPSGC